ncbi:MAG: 5'/3'-nucleotidase SurE [Anaerohalosphaeraceae bacterium]
MHILLTNDDGIFAPGLAALYKRLTTLGKVTVVAPADVQSGAGHSISLRDLTCQLLDIVGKFSGYSVDGSPADCVKVAINKLVPKDEPIDLLVSGMNHGANVGINVFYSGTVAGAIEGAFYDLPAIAVSAAMDEPWDSEQAADLALDVIKQILPIQPREVVSINIPRLSQGKPCGIKVVPQSTCGFDEFYQVVDEQEDQAVYRLAGGNHRDQHDEKNWTDTTALTSGYITLTSLRLNLTEPTGNERLAGKIIQSK